MGIKIYVRGRSNPSSNLQSDASLGSLANFFTRGKLRAPMEPERTPAREIGVGYTHVGLGCTFAGGIVAFMAAGWFLDRWLRVTPLFTIVGTLVGAALSILWVYAKLRAEAEAEKQRRAEKRP